MLIEKHRESAAVAITTHLGLSAASITIAEIWRMAMMCKSQKYRLG